MKNSISQETFDRETRLCKGLAQGKKCNWGVCKDCGVVPLLIKLRKGKLLEKHEEIEQAKELILEEK